MKPFPLNFKSLKKGNLEDGIANTVKHMLWQAKQASMQAAKSKAKYEQLVASEEWRGERWLFDEYLTYRGQRHLLMDSVRCLLNETLQVAKRYSNVRSDRTLAEIQRHPFTYRA